MLHLAIIGDYNATNPSHVVTNEAFDHVSNLPGMSFQYEWVDTERAEPDFDTITKTYDGYLISPGSPYKSMSGVLKVIEYARTHNIPTLGTCGGFQHMVIEFARNVLNIQDAEHAETNPYASRLVINPLSCSLRGQTLQIDIVDKTSKVSDILKTDTITEEYYCNFGLNPEYQQQIHKAGFTIVGSDVHKEARILELKDHPFFIGTLFVPQHTSRFDQPHPLLVALIKVMEKLSIGQTRPVRDEISVAKK
jgi:CTP synthase (UTP-ammonia lyase)